MLLGLVTMGAVIVALLPASLAARWLPRGVQAEDFSGSVWHGSIGRIRIRGIEAGALEWQLHPAALLQRALDTDLHWVRGGFVLDGRLRASGRDLTVAPLEGGGPLQDLAGLGLPVGVRGLAAVKLARLSVRLTDRAPLLTAAAGTLEVGGLALPQIAGATDLGGYALEISDSVSSPQQLVGRLHDTGGPLGLDAEVRLTPATRTGILSGTLAARGPLSPPLEQAFAGLARLHAADAQGRVPVDLEFTF